MWDLCFLFSKPISLLGNLSKGSLIILSAHMTSVGKVILKATHYNIALLSYSLWKVMHCVIFVLLFVTWTGFAYLFFDNKIPKSKFFWQL